VGDKIEPQKPFSQEKGFCYDFPYFFFPQEKVTKRTLSLISSPTNFQLAR